MRTRHEAARRANDPGGVGESGGGSRVWPILLLNSFIGFYLLERWLIRPQLATIFGVAETRNFGPPDIWALILFTVVAFLPGGMATITRTIRLFAIPLGCLLGGGWIGVLTASQSFQVDVIRAFWASGQLLFCFIVAGTVLGYFSARAGMFYSLLSFSGWVGLGGAFSVTERLGLTSINPQEFYRLENPLFGVNGFYVAGLIIPFLLLGLASSITNRRYILAGAIGAIFVLSQIGVLLSGVRTGIVISGLGVMFTIAISFHRSTAKGAGLVGGVTAVLVLGLVSYAFLSQEGGALSLTETMQLRADANQSLLQDSDRSWVYSMALQQLTDGNWLLGNGINQWSVINSTEVIHNVLLMAWWECGVIGLVGWTYLYISGIIKLVVLGFKGTPSIVFWPCVFVLVGSLAAGMAYPIGYSRTDWLLFLLTCAPLTAGASLWAEARRPRAMGINLPPGSRGVFKSQNPARHPAR